MKQKAKHIIALLIAAVLLCTNIPLQPSVVWAAGRTFDGMDPEVTEWVDEAAGELAQIVAERNVMALVYLSDTYPLRAMPDMEGEVLVTLLSGQMVNILDIYVDEDYRIWELVELDYKGETMKGYIPRDYLAVSDARFLEWEDMYGMGGSRTVYAVDGEGTATYADIEVFPDSYKQALTALKEQHPNWTFVKFNTTLDWATSVTEELKGGKSLVYYTFPDWAKEGLYDDGKWYYASKAALELYMDPRNALTEDAIFQFEQLTYNETYHTKAALDIFLNNTFMNDSKNAPGTAMTYSTILYALGKEEGREVSPFHLAARILQEQGQGTSPLISGTYPGYEGYYNYFNIGATGASSEEYIVNGLKYAKSKDWVGAYYSIMGGADFISKDYIKKGQDTLYLQKFNVNPNAAHKPYTHQYMQNISAPTTEALSIKKLYAGANSLDNTFVFSIPVYENMPCEPCAEPELSTDVVLDLPEGYTDTSIWLDGVEYQGEMRNEKLIATAPDGNAKTAVMYKYNESGVPTGMYVWSLSYSGTAYTATPEPELEDLLTYHGFSIRITGKTGIRIKTGIDTQLRDKLLTDGANGYTMTKYGTLVMKNENRGTYPMVVGGQKLIDGVIYGYDANGNWNNKYFEIKNDRLRYGSVLTGLPVNQYKVDYAFRGYAVLNKDGQEVVLYGPVTYRSIYALAEQLLASGSYAPGTDAHTFLSGLIADADALEPPVVGGESGDGSTSTEGTGSGESTEGSGTGTEGGGNSDSTGIAGGESGEGSGTESGGATAGGSTTEGGTTEGGSAGAEGEGTGTEGGSAGTEGGETGTSESATSGSGDVSAAA